MFANKILKKTVNVTQAVIAKLLKENLEMVVVGCL